MFIRRLHRREAAWWTRQKRQTLDIRVVLAAFVMSLVLGLFVGFVVWVFWEFNLFGGL